MAGPARAGAQVDQARAETYFKEAAALCERDGGRLWGVSLCGPMVIADAATKTIATNQPPPDAPRPAMLGFANAAINWGGTQWTAIVWPLIAGFDEPLRARLMVHELFHRVQRELGLMTPDGTVDHLDTLDGRYWLRLEWRALSRALESSGPARAAAIADALAFRRARRTAFPSAAENEQPDEIREGMAQYTSTVVAAPSRQAALDDARAQLADNEKQPSFVRTFAYPSGAAYGLLLDEASPGWRGRLRAADDIGQLLMAAARVEPSSDAAAAALRYDGTVLRAAEEKREAEHRVRVANLRQRFVDGPVVIVPGANGSFVTAGVTAIPGAGTVYPSFRATAPWGVLQADLILRTPERPGSMSLPGPPQVDGATVKGDGWTIALSPGWELRPGSRAGDLQVVRTTP